MSEIRSDQTSGGTRPLMKFAVSPDLPIYSDIQTSRNWIASHGRSVMRLNRHALFLCSNYAQHDQAPYLFSDLITIDVFIWLTINICLFASVYIVLLIWDLTAVLRAYFGDYGKWTHEAIFVIIKIFIAPLPRFHYRVAERISIKEMVWQNVLTEQWWYNKIK